MNKIFLVVLALVSSTSAWGADRDLLTPEPRRITDEAIAADIRVIQGLQGRLAGLNNKGIPIASYHFAKAQAWLDFAMDEYTINDRSRVVEEALHQALSLIEKMEAGEKEIGMSTPVIPTSSIVRADLWDKAETLKKRISPRCAGDKVAQLEVQLVWAGHENREFGWRHSKPYLQAAERLAREADAQMEPCPPLPKSSAKVEPAVTKVEPAVTKVEPAVTKVEPAVTKVEPAVTKVEPAVAKVEPAVAKVQLATVMIESLPAKVEPAAATPVAMAALSEPAADKPATAAPDKTAVPAMTLPASHVVTVLTAKAPCIQLKCPEPVPAAGINSLEPLPDRVHFAFDRADVSAASSAVLIRIAAAMKNDPTLRVVLYGHADQRGNLYYNMTLSRQRAEAVRGRLISAGVGANRVSVAPIGKLQPFINEKSIEAYARNRRVEFLFMLGPSHPLIDQSDDLQPEGKHLESTVIVTTHDHAS